MSGVDMRRTMPGAEWLDFALIGLYDDNASPVAFHLTDRPITVDLSRYVITGHTGQTTVETVIGPDGEHVTEYSTPVSVESVKRRGWLSRAWRRVRS